MFDHGIYYDVETQVNEEGWIGTIVDICVILNAIIVIYISATGIEKWWKMPFIQDTVPPLLMLSIIVVIGEVIHRFGPRDIAPLFILQAVA